MRKFSVSLAALALLASVPGVAQQYCSGSIVADSFYSNVRSTGSASIVEYFVEIRNATANPVLISAHFAPNKAGATFSNLLDTRKTLKPRTSEKLPLGVQKFTNPSGKGKLEAGEMKAAFQLFCAAH